MTRVSTYGNFQSALLDLMAAQTRGLEAQERVSTQKVATDLTGFGRGAETLTALKSAQARIQGFMDTGEAVAARLATQDLALGRVIEGAEEARSSVANALAAGRLDGLMLELQSQFQVAKEGLNARHQGRYLFSGGNVENVAVDTATLADLAAAPAVADVFRNDTLRSSSRLDEGSTVQTGFLADEIGGPLFEVFRDIQLYQQGVAVTVGGQTWTPTGPGTINGKTTPETTAFLTAQLGRFDTAREGITSLSAFNGSLQNRVDNVIQSHESQHIALEELVGDRTNADMAKAITDLELSQVAIQASAQVLNQLRQISLLNFLR
jgi:flagellar hook-associated protein 3 FlgL